MHFSADTVSDHFSHYRESVFFGVMLNGVTYIAERNAFSDCLDGFEKAFFGDVDEFFLFGGNFPYAERSRSIAVESAVISAQIDADELSLFYNYFIGRNTVNYHIVYRYACRRGISVIIKTRRVSAARYDVFV